MAQKTFINLAGLIFGAKAIFGLYFLLASWQVTLASWTIPIWLTVVAVVIDAYLAYTAFKLTKIIK